MPLGGLLSGGVFETWLDGEGYRPRVRVSLHDHTGLVRGMIAEPDGASGLVNPRGNRLALSVPIDGGCGDYAVRLAFRHAGDGFVLEQRNDELGCAFDSLIGHGSVLISLWSRSSPSTRIQLAARS